MLSPSVHKHGHALVPSGLSAEGATAAHALENETRPHLRLEALRQATKATQLVVAVCATLVMTAGTLGAERHTQSYQQLRPVGARGSTPHADLCPTCIDAVLSLISES